MIPRALRDAHAHRARNVEQSGQAGATYGHKRHVEPNGTLCGIFER